jgi:hypothetical protein
MNRAAVVSHPLAPSGLAVTTQLPAIALAGFVQLVVGCTPAPCTYPSLYSATLEELSSGLDAGRSCQCVYGTH